jgi:hypothetical protein
MIGSGPITPGNIGGASGGGGGTNSKILTNQTIIAGSGDIAHTLDEEPETVEFFSAAGAPLVINWVAKAGSLTTIITTSNNPMLQNGATIKLTANS